MNGQPAIILMQHELQHILNETAKAAAAEVITAFRNELTADPVELHAQKLRTYIQDRSTVLNPRDTWANGLHIRSIKLNAKGQPRSISWFQKFKLTSGLIDCASRPSSMPGGQREWCFEDVANAYESSR